VGQKPVNYTKIAVTPTHWKERTTTVAVVKTLVLEGVAEQACVVRHSTRVVPGLHLRICQMITVAASSMVCVAGKTCVASKEVHAAMP